jgi:hypothetical protein
MPHLQDPFCFRDLEPIARIIAGGVRSRLVASDRHPRAAIVAIGHEQRQCTPEGFHPQACVGTRMPRRGPLVDGFEYGQILGLTGQRIAR